MAQIAGNVFDVTDFGAVGDATTLNTQAFRQAIEACHSAGGGTVLVPPGDYMTGTVTLLDNVGLHLVAGSVVRGSGEIGDYERLPFDSWGRSSALIRAVDASNVSITGLGTIDGNVDEFADYTERHAPLDVDETFTRQGELFLEVARSPEDGPVQMRERPDALVLIIGCQYVHLSGVKVVNAPNWCVHLACSEDAVLTGLEFKSSMLAPNSDCIDVSLCRNVRISDCNLAAGDDGLAFSPCADGFLRTGIDRGIVATENIVVQNCTIVSRSAAIRIGWGAGDFRNLLFSNIVIRESNRGIGIFVRENETIEDILFSNITIDTRLYRGGWWGLGEPIHMSAVKGFAHSAGGGRIRNVRFSNVSVRGEQGSVLWSDADYSIEDIVFENARFEIVSADLQERIGGNFDFRPALEPGRNLFEHSIPVLSCRNIEGLRLLSTELRRGPGLPDWTVEDLELDRVERLVVS